MRIKDYSLRIDEEQLAKLHYIADHNARSVNRELLRLIRQHINAFEKEFGPIPIEVSESNQ